MPLDRCPNPQQQCAESRAAPAQAQPERCGDRDIGAEAMALRGCQECPSLLWGERWISFARCFGGSESAATFGTISPVFRARFNAIPIRDAIPRRDPRDSVEVALPPRSTMLAERCRRSSNGPVDLLLLQFDRKPRHEPRQVGERLKRLLVERVRLQLRALSRKVMKLLPHANQKALEAPQVECPERAQRSDAVAPGVSSCTTAPHSRGC